MKKKILVVDDEEMFCRGASNLLERAGYDVSVARNGQETSKILSEVNFDLVLLDLCLPDIYGTEVISEIKKVNPDTRIVVVTGYGAFGFERKEIEDKTQGYFLKPIDFNELIVSIKKILSRKNK